MQRLRAHGRFEQLQQRSREAGSGFEAEDFGCRRVVVRGVEEPYRRSGRYAAQHPACYGHQPYLGRAAGRQGAGPRAQSAVDHGGTRILDRIRPTRRCGRCALSGRRDNICQAGRRGCRRGCVGGSERASSDVAVAVRHASSFRRRCREAEQSQDIGVSEHA